jgi:tRNA 2-thiouridine synthesizing protein A
MLYEQVMSEIRLDLRGLKCPLPALKTRKALRGAEPGSLIIVQSTDPMAAIDLANLARETGDILESREETDGYAVFHIRKKSG